MIQALSSKHEKNGFHTWLGTHGGRSCSDYLRHTKEPRFSTANVRSQWLPCYDLPGRSRAVLTRGVCVLCAPCSHCLAWAERSAQLRTELRRGVLVRLGVC